MNKDFNMLKKKKGIIMAIWHYLGAQELSFVENYIHEVCGRERWREMWESGDKNEKMEILPISMVCEGEGYG